MEEEDEEEEEEEDEEEDMVRRERWSEGRVEGREGDEGWVLQGMSGGEVKRWAVRYKSAIIGAGIDAETSI